MRAQNRFKWRAATVILGIAVAMAAGSAWAMHDEDHAAYILNTSTGAPYAKPDRTGFLDLLVAEAFKRIGKSGEVALYAASKRALLNADANIDQGVAMRVKNLEQKYPNLVRIPEPVIDNDFVAYSRGLDFATTDWSTLKPYAITHIHGWVIFERNVPQGAAVTTVREPGQMFDLLLKNRADVALYERWQGLQRARDQGLDLHVHEPPLASVKMYMYVHKVHADLVEPLDGALKAMKADGTYQAIFDRSLAPLMPAAE